MVLEETNNYSVFSLSSNKSKNNKMIITFPTSNGYKYDLINFNVLDSIVNEGIIFVFIQTNDYDCFYNLDLTDKEKSNNLNNYILEIEKDIQHLIIKYDIKTIPVLLGLSLGGYYSHLIALRNPNKFHCISLSGVCDLELLDKNQTHHYITDKVINYETKKYLWKHLNPINLIDNNTISKFISCFGNDDNLLIDNAYSFYENLDCWNYIKVYPNELHNFSSWSRMIYDIFKSNSKEFHDFRKEFYSIDSL